MDNENTMLTEQAEATETSDAFDEGWDDTEESGYFTDGWSEGDGDDDDRDTDEDGEEPEADADQRDADGTDGEGETDGQDGEEAAEGTQGSPDQGKAEEFELRYLGEVRTVNREDVIKLAQQGMDYQRIRERWDGVKDDVPKLRMYEGFLQELADSRGGDIDSLIDETRTRSLMARAEAEGRKLTAAQAAAQAVQARLKAMEKDEAKRAEANEEEETAKRRASVDRFMSLYGSEIKAEDIPQAVWDDAERVGDLTVAYQKYRQQKLETENKELRDSLEKEKQHQKNKERSMGSSKSAGSGAARDPFDEGWDDF